jgi:hypothetical protein
MKELRGVVVQPLLGAVLFLYLLVLLMCFDVQALRSASF